MQTAIIIDMSSSSSSSSAVLKFNDHALQTDMCAGQQSLLC